MNIILDALWERNMTTMQRYRHRQSQRGLCQACPKPHAPGDRLCAEHREKHRIACRIYREKHQPIETNRSKYA